MYIVNPKLQEINIPGIRKLRGGAPLSEPIIEKLKAENQLSNLEKNEIIINKEKKEITEKSNKVVTKK
jgi:hypothetical protein